MRPLGWKRGPADDRDFDASVKLRAAPVPPAASVKDLVVEILDQGQLGSCVAHAVAQAVRIEHARTWRANLPLRQWVKPPALLSRLMTYYLARSYEGTIHQDAGCWVRDAFRALKNFGFAPEQAWPYQVDRFDRMPAAEAFREAFDQQATSYHRILDTGSGRIAQIKQAIASGHAVVFGTDVSNAFCLGNLDPVAERPPADKDVAGGHALCCVGYDGDVFEVANSWSDGWSTRRGYVLFHESYMLWERTDDIWLVDDAPPFSSP